jgi:hypothetical protein
MDIGYDRPPIELGGYVGERHIDARPAAIDGVNVMHSVTAEFNSAQAIAVLSR